MLGVIPAGPARTIDIEQLHLLEALAGLVALALERAQLESEAEQIRVDIETERLRNSLLSAVSHDLRTPLSVITGASSTLLENGVPQSPKCAANSPLRSWTSANSSIGWWPISST